MTFNRNAYITGRADPGGLLQSIKCPRCGMVSRHPFDVAEGYCGLCHDWTSPPRLHNPALTVGDAEAARVVAELVTMEHLGDRERFAMGPYTAYLVIAAIQLACRHPAMSPTNRAELIRAATDLSGLFDPKVRDIIDRGWDQSQDHPVTTDADPAQQT